MPITLYGIPTCDACRKASRWLNDHGLAHGTVNLKDDPAPAPLLATLLATGAADRKKLFNVAGARYRELDLKTRLPTLTDADAVALLATEGMLLKRPLITDGTRATVGFREPDLAAAWGPAAARPQG